MKKAEALLDIQEEGEGEYGENGSKVDDAIDVGSASYGQNTLTKRLVFRIITMRRQAKRAGQIRMRPRKTGHKARSRKSMEKRGIRQQNMQTKNMKKHTPRTTTLQLKAMLLATQRRKVNMQRDLARAIGLSTTTRRVVLRTTTTHLQAKQAGQIQIITTSRPNRLQVLRTRSKCTCKMQTAHTGSGWSTQMRTVVLPTTTTFQRAKQAGRLRINTKYNNYVQRVIVYIIYVYLFSSSNI